MMVCLYPRHADEHRRKHGEHVGLDKCNQHFHTIHEDTEQHRHDTHGRADDCPHTGGHEHNAGQCQDDGVSRHDVGKQTDHQGKGLGENAEQLDGWHDGHRTLQPHRHFRPKDFFPIFLGAEYIDRNKCTQCQDQCNGNIAGHIASTRKDRYQAHEIIDKDEEKGRE